MTPEGDYSAVIVKGITTKAQTGNPQMAVLLHITHDASNGEWRQLNEIIERNLYIALTDSAMPYAEQKLKTLGFNGDFGQPEFAIKAVAVICTHDDYQGKTRERWDLREWGEKPDAERADDDVVRQLNAKWKARQANAQRNAPPAVDSAPSPPSSPVPF